MLSGRNRCNIIVRWFIKYHNITIVCTWQRTASSFSMHWLGLYEIQPTIVLFMSLVWQIYVTLVTISLAHYTVIVSENSRARTHTAPTRRNAIVNVWINAEHDIVYQYILLVCIKSIQRSEVSEKKLTCRVGPFFVPILVKLKLIFQQLWMAKNWYQTSKTQRNGKKNQQKPPVLYK